MWTSRRWRMAGVLFGCWLVLYLLGELLLPAGDFRDLAWPILAGGIVYVSSCVHLRRLRYRQR